MFVDKDLSFVAKKPTVATSKGFGPKTFSLFASAKVSLSGGTWNCGDLWLAGGPNHKSVILIDHF